MIPLIVLLRIWSVRLLGWLFVWLVGWLVGVFGGWLVGVLGRCLFSWSVCGSGERMALLMKSFGRVFSWWIDWSVGR